MKKITPLMRASLNAEVRTLAVCLKVTAARKTTGYTSHQTDLELEGIAYKALPGLTCGTISSDLLAPDKPCSLHLLRTEDTEKFIEWLQELSTPPHLVYRLVNYENKATLNVRAGAMGEVTYTDQKITVALLSVTDQLGTEIGELYSQTCRAALGDKRCGVDIEPLRIEGEVTKIDDQIHIRLLDQKASCDYGALIWLSGQNQGLTDELKKNEKESEILTFSLPPFARIAVGDKFKLVPSCNKTARCCQEIYQNILNFRGEPNIPQG